MISGDDCSRLDKVIKKMQKIIDKRENRSLFTKPLYWLFYTKDGYRIKNLDNDEITEAAGPRYATILLSGASFICLIPKIGLDPYFVSNNYIDFRIERIIGVDLLSERLFNLFGKKQEVNYVIGNALYIPQANFVSIYTRTIVVIAGNICSYFIGRIVDFGLSGVNRVVRGVYYLVF